MQNNQSHLALLAVLAGTGMNVNAHAADETAMLDEIVVSGSRAETSLAETPLAIGVVKDAVLKRDKPKTMGDVINRIPGVHWNDLVSGGRDSNPAARRVQPQRVERNQSDGN